MSGRDAERLYAHVRRLWLAIAILATALTAALVVLFADAAHAQASPAPVLPGPASAGAGENPPRIDVRPRHIRLRASRSEVRRPLRRRRARFHTGIHPGSQWLSLGTLNVTAYCATGNPTASGVMPHAGMVATLDRSIPFGAQLHVDGLGTYTVRDRIGYGSDVDVYLGDQADCENAALTFGRERRAVEVLVP